MSRILIVEDEADIVLGLEDDLTMEGHDVEVVRDGETACRRGREGAWDLILLDVMLPGKDGFEVCRELRSSGVQTPIIMLTAKVQEAEKVLGLELGARRLRDQAVQPARAARPGQGRGAALLVLPRRAPTALEMLKWTSPVPRSAAMGTPSR